jgi:hypothetical protein
VTDGGPGAATGGGDGGARREVLATALAFGLPLALYVLTAARSVQGGDTAEFVMVAAAGGVPHPPGYPLHTMLARLAAAVPLGPVALRVALLSAVCAAGAVAVLQRALRRLTGSLGASLGAALAFAVAPIQWQLAGVPEVFSLAALLAAATVLAAARLADTAPGRAGRAGLLLGLVAGLGLANHHTWVLCAPVLVWAVAASWRAHGAHVALRAAAAAVAGVALGLTAYAWLPHGAATPGGWVWGEPGTARGLLRHVLRSEYGTVSLGLSAAPRRPLAHVAQLLGALPRAFLHLFFVAGLVGVVVAFRRRRGFAIAALIAFVLAGVAFPAWFNLPDSALARAVAARFHLLPTLLFALFVGFGLAAALPRLSRLPGALLLAAPLALGALWTYGSADWRADRTIERYLTAAVRDLAPDAVILGQGDVELFGFNYVRRALRVRPDVRYVDVHLLRRSWYHAAVGRDAPDLALPYDPRTTHLYHLVDAVAAKRPTYLTISLARLAPDLPLRPEGLLARVQVPGQPAPAPATLEAAAERAFAELGPLPPPRDAWGAYVRDQAAEPWRVLAHAYGRAGDAPRALACRARADQLVAGGGP